ncbi:hypothetical protein F7725_003538 [Dissostichus mawsoni]|uniref:Uncharacterized protein n=1 Tax=Dissostichus mawsoni TaxID=36200 RepID=A0A7J5YAK2_DISMA|nr:hypothetical protein F7725_003538 [Dissostichus mawsoni]
MVMTTYVGNAKDQLKLSKLPSKFRPRGFVKPDEREPLWRSGLKTMCEHQARVGPLMVLPAKQKSRPIPAEERSSILDNISRSTMYGSQWRSRINGVGKSIPLNCFSVKDQRKGLLPDSSSTQNHVDVLTLASEQNEDKSGTEKDEDAEEVHELLEKNLS